MCSLLNKYFSLFLCNFNFFLLDFGVIGICNFLGRFCRVVDWGFECSLREGRFVENLRKVSLIFPVKSQGKFR
jgi:hypothetical protein